MIFRRGLWFPVLAILSVLIGLLGCGSGGDVGTGTGDPIELEVGAILDAFIGQIEARDATKAMEFVDTNLTYFRVGSPTTYTVFKDRLYDFLQNVDQVTFKIEGRGIVSSGEEDAAEARGKLVYSYRPKTQANSVEVSESNFEIFLSREGTWGILSFGSAENPTSFPPEL